MTSTSSAFSAKTSLLQLNSGHNAGATTPRQCLLARRDDRKWGKSLILPQKEDILAWIRSSTTPQTRESMFHYTDYEVIKAIWTANHRLSLVMNLQQQQKQRNAAQGNASSDQGTEPEPEMPFLEAVVIGKTILYTEKRKKSECD